MTTLEQRFRRLLRAYPRWYRAEREDEMVATYLDSSADEQSRPSGAQRRDLLTSGLRCRFQVRGGGLARTLAVITALVFAMGGVCLGSWLGWQSAEELPSDAAVNELSRTVFPGEKPDKVQRMESPFGYDTELAPGGGSDPAWTVALLGGDDYIVGKVLATYADSSSADRPRADAVADGLRDKGWSIHTSGSSRLVAEKDGLVLGAWYVDGRSPMEFTVQPGEPVAVLPLGIIGGVFAALAGWLLSVRLARLVKLRSPARGPVVAVFALVGFSAAALPWSLAVLGYIRSFFVSDPSNVFVPLWSFSFILLRAMCWAAVLFGLAAVATVHWPRSARPRPAERFSQVN